MLANCEITFHEKISSSFAKFGHLKTVSYCSVVYNNTTCVPAVEVVLVSSLFLSPLLGLVPVPPSLQLISLKTSLYDTLLFPGSLRPALPFPSLLPLLVFECARALIDGVNPTRCGTVEFRLFLSLVFLDIYVLQFFFVLPRELVAWQPFLLWPAEL